MSWTTKALVDTGAPFTVFDRASGDALGVKFHRSDATYTWHELAGKRRKAQTEFATIRLPSFEEMWWETEVHFLIDDWNMPFGGLLGQQGFLDRWSVTFNFSENYFVVEELESFKSRLPLDVDQQFERLEDRDQGWRGPLHK